MNVYQQCVPLAPDSQPACGAVSYPSTQASPPVCTGRAEICHLGGLLVLTPAAKARARKEKVPRLGYALRLHLALQQQDGIPVKQPVAPSSAHAARHPLLGGWAKSEPRQPRTPPWLREPLPAPGQTGAGGECCSGIQGKKIYSGRKNSKPSFKEIIKLLSDGRGRVSHPLEREMPLAYEMMPLAFHPLQAHDSWLGKALLGHICPEICP